MMLPVKLSLLLSWWQVQHQKTAVQLSCCNCIMMLPVIAVKLVASTASQGGCPTELLSLHSDATSKAVIVIELVASTAS